MMQIIPRQPVGTVGSYNQVGHFKELVAGASSNVFKSSSVFKVNREGIFAGRGSYTQAKTYGFAVSYAGQMYATGATVSGTITATGGSITGDLIVSGSLYSDTGGYRTRLSNGRLSFLYNNVEKAYIMASDNGTGLQISSSQNIYLTRSNGVPIVQVGQDGGMSFGSPGTAYLAWGDRQLRASGSAIMINGDLEPYAVGSNHDVGTQANGWNNFWAKAAYHIYGNRRSSGGSNTFWAGANLKSNSGNDNEIKTSGTVGMVTAIDFDDKKAKYREIIVLGGIVVGFSKESDWL